MRRQRRSLATSALLLGLWGAGCGSKTGLERPDAGASIGFDAGPVDAPVRCVEVPVTAEPIPVAFALPVSLAVIDLFFLIDGTASMEDEIDNIRQRLTRTVVPGVRALIPDAAFGLSFVGEFPVDPHGPDGVRPYELRVPIGGGVSSVEAALGRVPDWGNFDDPEAQVEGLYQVMTGEGLDPFIPPSFGCPMGGTGGVCFREDSLPVVALITDAPFHNGPGGSEPYAPEIGAHTYEEAVAATREVGALVIGLGATDPARPEPLPDLRALARDTGAGERFVIDIGRRGTEVGENVVQLVQRLAEGLPLDVDAVALPIPGTAIDATTLVTAVRPRSASPPEGIGGIVDGRFIDVSPGTVVNFEVILDASVLSPSDSTRRTEALILFRAFGRSRLGSQRLEIVIPGTDGEGCDR